MSQVLETPNRIKRLIVDSLHLEGIQPEMIQDEAPLFGEGLGLDSVDALELVVALEKEFGIKIKSQEMGREVFSLVAFPFLRVGESLWLRSMRSMRSRWRSRASMWADQKRRN